MSSTPSLPGERKPVTILFTDIAGSTAMAERLDPEEWREVVQGAHRIVGEVVRRYDGTVAQYLGDGVLAFFGAPVTHEDDPLRAVRSALEIQQGIEDYARQLKGLVEEFQMRVGIHSGTVVVGQVGDAGHMEYLAIGDAVNLASRLQSEAPPGSVLISQTVARQARQAFELEDLGEIQIKGKSRAVQVYRVLRPSEIQAPGHGIPGLASPFVGRESELEQLGEALERLEQGSGGMVFILGEAGIGKSRLVEQVRRSAPPDVRWLEGRALSYGEALSFWTISQLVRADLGLSDGDPQVRIKVALRRRVGELLGERQGEALPYLAHLLGVATDPDWSAALVPLEGETLKRQLLLGVQAYFCRLAEQQPLALVFEDLHWCDPSSLEAVETLLPLCDRCPLLLVFLARPEREHGSWRIRMQLQTDYEHRLTEINLKPLTNRQEQQLVDNLLSVAVLPEDLRRRILERSEGNPFYLEEVLQSLIEQGGLVYQDGCWSAPHAIEQIEIPDTLQGVLLSRIDRLQEDVRQTLQLAAVIGKSFLYRLLQAISQAECRLDEHLSQLQRVDLVREKCRRPELEYIFKHTLTQEAAYSSLLIERRTEFHRQVAQALEQLFADRAQEYYGLLAYHYECAGEKEKAALYLIKEGDRRRLEDAFKEAVELYSRAIPLLEALGDTETEARTWLKLGLVHQAGFEFEQAHRAFEQAFILQRQGLAAEKTPAYPPSSHPTIFQIGAVSHKYPLLDTQLANNNLEIELLTSLFAGLVEYDLDANALPHVARSWEVLDDGRRYLFHLRDDARWTDGTPVTAADFERAWKRNLRPGGPQYPPSLLDDVRGAHAYRTGQNPDPAEVGVRAVDPLTLEVELSQPVAYFISLMAFPVAFPMHPRMLERRGAELGKGGELISNGPFRLVEADGAHMKLERNPGYFGDFQGNLDGFDLHFFQFGDPAIVRRFLDGELDLSTGLALEDLHIDVPPELQQLKCGLISTALTLNPCRPPLDDLRVRQALRQGLDLDRFVHASVPVQKGCCRGGLVPPGMPGHSPELGYPYDPARARRLLAEAGYPGGKGMSELRFGFDVRFAGLDELFESFQKDLGVRCELEISQSATRPEAFADVDMSLSIWTADYPDPDTFLRDSVVIDSLKAAGWRHPRYEALIEQARRSNDRLERMRLYREADRILVNKEALVIPLVYNLQRGIDLVQPWLSNREPDAFGNQHFKYIRLEKRR